MQIDRSQNVRDFGRGHIELGQQFDLAAGNRRVHLEFLRYGYKIFLQHLQRDDTRPRTPVLSDKIQRLPLFCGIGLVIGIDEYVGVEEAAGRHYRVRS